MKKDLYRVVGIAGALVLGVIIASVVYTRTQRQERAAQVAQKTQENASIMMRPHSRTMGPADAKVTLVEFFDPECESCRAVYPLVKHLLAQYPGQVRLVLRYMPLHPNSIYAASALEAAGEQGRYWEMLEIMFLNQPHWGNHHAPKPELIPEYAQQIGLDMQAFRQSVDKEAHRKIVEIDRADGKALGVTGTPTFFVNGKPLDRLGYDGLKAMVDAELAKSP